MSASNDSLKKIQKDAEEGLDRVESKLDAVIESSKTLHKEIKNTGEDARVTFKTLEKGIEVLSKANDLNANLMKDMAGALKQLRLIPNELSAVNKYQDMLIKSTERYSAELFASNDTKRDALTFLKDERKSYNESIKKYQETINSYEKLVASGKKLASEQKKEYNLAKKEVEGTSSLIDALRTERNAIDEAAKSKSRDASASAKKGKATKDAAEKGKKATKEEIAANKELSKSLTKILEDVTRIRAAINTGGGLKVQINNAGFTKVLDEMANAIDRFHERAEGSTPRKKNFFDQVLGTREENKKSGDEVVKEAKHTISQIGSSFIDPLSNNLTEKISKAVSKGIKNGIIEGTIEASHSNPANTELVNLADRMGLSKAQKQRLLTNMMDKKDLTAIEQTQILETRKLKQHQYDTRNANKTKVDIYKANLDFEYNVNPQAVNERIEAKARYENVKAMREENKLQRELEKAKRDEYNRQINAKEKVRVEKELANVYGEEGSKIRKLGEDLVLLQAKRREYMIQGDELNKINFAELANNTRKIQETTRKWAEEVYRVKNKTQETSSLIKNMQNVYTRIASLTQTASAALSAASGIFSTMRTAATSFFRYFTNGFRRAFAYVRMLASSTLNAGIEQRKKIEQAQIGFASFFGEENVQSVTSSIRSQAAKTPIVDAGALAEYVQQLAPISNGNASLAINASLGILKSLVYSGSDISEGEYVIKNIRDVIAKGKATAIDIRQFNRALPGLETALGEAGLTEFLNKQGQLNINKKNVGKVLDLFATLNTDANSPLRTIEEKQLHTLNGLQQLFTEKKTTAMETILEKSGFFDLMYDVFGIANDEGKWRSITNFISETIKPLIKSLSSMINSVNWNDLRAKVSSFFGTIWEGVKIAKETIGTALSNAVGGKVEDIIFRIANIIKNFIVGFGSGVKDVIDFASDVIKRLSGGNLEKFAEMVGKYLVSPLGKLIQMMLGLGQNGLGAFSRVSANIASLYKGIGDLWNWAVNQKSTKFSDRIVSNLRVSDMTAAQLQQVISGKAVTASGKNGTAMAAAGAAVLGKESLTAGEKIKSFGLSAARVGIKLLSAVAAGGTIYTVTIGLSEFIRGLNRSNDAVQNTADVVETLGTALAGGVAGSMLGGLSGGLIGAVLGASAALIKLKVSAMQAAEQKSKEAIAKLEGEERKNIYNQIMDVMKKQGINTDTGTDEGWYASQKLTQFLNTQDPSSVDINAAVASFTNALKWKNQQRDLYDTANSAAFNNLSNGKILDLNSQSSLRDNLDYIIRYYRLNGDNYEYTSAESNIRDFMNAGGMNEEAVTEEQARMIIDRCTYLDGTLDDNTTELGKVINSVDLSRDATEDQIKALSKSTGMTEEAIKAIVDLQTEMSSWRNSDEYNKAAQGWNESWGGNSLWSQIQRGFSILFGSGTDTEDNKAYLHDRSNFDPTASGQGNFTYFGNEGKEYNVFAEDIANALVTWLYENYDGNTEKLPITEYRLFKQALSDIQSKYSSDTAGFMNEYQGKLPWLWEYVKKVILLQYKQIGGMITPIYRATGGALGVDTVPAMLQPGEFVMRKSAANKIGLSTLFALNRGDLASAARSLGSRFGSSYNNSRNWNSVVNNNQKTQSNYFRIFNKNTSSRVSSYYGFANRIALS